MLRVRKLTRRAFGVAALGAVATRPALAGSTQTREATVANRTATELLDGYVAALNAQDGVQAASFYSEDATVTQVVQDGNTFTGREEIAGWVDANVAGLPDLAVTIGRVVERDGTLMWEWTYAGAYTGQFPGAPAGRGQAVELRGVSVMELRDGEIAAETLYYDNLSFLNQIGAGGAATPAS